ncbi:hypothetical protein FOXYS1_14788, partial [Fusarium oxysporum]
MNTGDLNATTSAVKDNNDSDWMPKADPFLSTPAASPETNRPTDVGELTSGNCYSDQDHDVPTDSLLNFADVPGQLSHLPFNPGSANPSSTYTPDPNSSLLTFSSSIIDTTPTSS